MARAELNGITIYYERWGSGPRLLYFNGSSSTLAGTRVRIDPYGEHFDLAVHDQRGLGQTSVPPGPYSMADYAADGAALMDHLGWGSCRVVGVSFGGMVAQELAVTWPERVERLALVCTSPGGDHASYPLHKLAGLDPEERRAATLGLLDTRFTPDWLAAHEGDRRLVEGLATFTAAVKTDEQQRGEREQLEARARHDVLDRLHRVTAPTLVASGRYDGIAPLENGEAIAARIPGAELRVYDGGHLFLAQDPRAHFEVIDFLSRPQPRA
jgi:3-oxoadipate enol-lactonase